MMQSGPSDYRSLADDDARARPASEPVTDQLSSMAGKAADEIGRVAGDLGNEIRQRPYTTLALAAGLAFAAGALWKLGRHRPRSRLEAWREKMPDLAARSGWLSRWGGR
jgi:hypothetical protein